MEKHIWTLLKQGGVLVKKNAQGPAILGERRDALQERATPAMAVVIFPGAARSAPADGFYAFLTETCCARISGQLVPFRIPLAREMLCLPEATRVLAALFRSVSF